MMHKADLLFGQKNNKIDIRKEKRLKKGKLFFNIILIIISLVLISAIGYVAYYYLSNYFTLKEAEQAVEEFENEVIVVAIEDTTPQENVQNTENETPQTSKPSSSTTSSSKVTYKGYSMIGTIQIPKTKVKAPIVDKVTPQSISAAVATLYGPGLNQVGNTVLVAHNYRNGTFFSNNKNLVVGDKIYITDSSGRKIEYSVYKTYTTPDTDFSYATRNTNGKREISLSTCTTDPNKRLVIWAREG